MVKGPAAFTVSPGKSLVDQTVEMEVMEEASLSEVGSASICFRNAAGLPMLKGHVCIFHVKVKLSPLIFAFIIVSANRFVKSLAQVRPAYKGEDGQSGGSKNCYGRNGTSSYICVSPCFWLESTYIFWLSCVSNMSLVCFVFVKVPVGTVVKEQGTSIVDLSEHGQEYVAVFGGAGGKGNRFFLSNENRAPMTATPGMMGQERSLQLELRTMAHAGLVGKTCLCVKIK